MLPRRRFLALLGLAPVAAPALAATALRPCAPTLLAGVDVSASGVAVSVFAQDHVGGCLRVIAATSGQTWEDVARDLDDSCRSMVRLHLLVADEVDPYPLPAGTDRAAVPGPMVGVSSLDWPGPAGPGPFGRRP